MVVHVIISVGLCPGEPKAAGVGPDSLEEGLEQGLVGGKLKGVVDHVDMEGRDCETERHLSPRGEKGESGPAILLHSEKAATGKA